MGVISVVTLSTAATAFLQHKGEYLLLKRAITRKIAPGAWAGVGGFLRPDEIDDPLAACVREIHEETGLSEKDISNLHLKYIVLRRSKAEIRVQYIYFGESCVREVVDTAEGKLFWVNENDLTKRHLAFTTRATLEHYLTGGKDADEIFVGTVSAENKLPKMNWHVIQDWEGI